MRKKEKKQSSRKEKTVWGRVKTGVSIALCILILPFFLLTMALLISAVIHPDVPPSVLGYTPFVVESGSMSPTFDAADLIIVKNETNGTYQEGDIVCFRDGDIYTTHRIVAVETDADGATQYTTRGDANNTPDQNRLLPSHILGRYQMRFPGLGGFLLYLQTPRGILFTMLPLLALGFLFYLPSKIMEKRQSRRLEEADGIEEHRKEPSDR